ncbi:MAG TPA: SMC family ATPase, partial [Gemmatimonadaceae bacterium]|nr:SMC family ATPase [Gemmatimonadaceae bacterium]
MRLNSLRLSNFRQHVDTRIDFDVGLTGIIGPNGSGKSTILEAVAWALYGMPAARGTRESVRSYRAGPRASVKVELDFELGGHRYLVSRGLNSAELYLDGAASPIATSISAVSELLRKRLGMSHDEFFNTYFTGQKQLSVMAAMTPSDRAQFLSRVLGYERLTAARALVRDRRSSIVAEATGLRAGLPDREAVNRAVAEAEARLDAARTQTSASEQRKTAAARSLSELTPRWESLQRDRDAALALAAEIRVAQGEREAVERDAARIGRELADLAAARTEMESLRDMLVPLDGLQEELTQLEQSRVEAARRGTLTDAARSLSEELERLRDRHSKIETAPALETETADALAQSRIELEAAQREFETMHTEWVRDAQEAETKRRALLDQLKDVQQQREQIVELGENGTCPICARPLESHFRSVLEFLDEQIETISSDGRYYRARIEQLSKMPPELASLDERRKLLAEAIAKLHGRLGKIQAAVQELSIVTRDIAGKAERHATLLHELSTIAVTYDAERHTEVRARAERLAPLAARAASLAARLEREPRVVEEHAQARERFSTASEKVADLELRRASNPFSAETFAATRLRYESSATELRGAELAAVAASLELAAADAVLESTRQASESLTKSEQRLAALNA